MNMVAFSARRLSTLLAPHSHIVFCFLSCRQRCGLAATPGTGETQPGPGHHTHKESKPSNILRALSSTLLRQTGTFYESLDAVLVTYSLVYLKDWWHLRNAHNLWKSSRGRHCCDVGCNGRDGRIR